MRLHNPAGSGVVRRSAGSNRCGRAAVANAGGAGRCAAAETGMEGTPVFGAMPFAFAAGPAARVDGAGAAEALDPVRYV